jgi:glycolate oxidase iron-sulfur subunit
MSCSAMNSIARAGGYLIKDMLENDRAPTQEVVKHIDRCLSCLACMTTCPSGVNYMHLVDQARVKVEEEYARPLSERFLRGVLAVVLPRPGLFRISMMGARLARPFAALIPSSAKHGVTPTFFDRLRAMLALAPGKLPAPGPSGGKVFLPRDKNAAASRCCKAAPSRFSLRGSIRLRSGS